MKKERLEKFSDYVYYYKWHALIALVVMLLVGFTARDCSRRVDEDVIVNVLISNSYNTGCSETISDELKANGLIPDINGDGQAHSYINVVMVPFENGMEAMQQAQIAFIQRDAVLFLVDEDLLEIYEDNFSDMSILLEKFGANVDDAYIAEDGSVLGISLKGNEFLERHGIITDTLYACYGYIDYSGMSDEMEIKVKTADNILEFILNR